MSEYVRNFFRFCIIALIQVLVLNSISLMWWSNPMGFPIFLPMIYPLFILLLPFETPVWLLLVLGFASGLIVGSFTNLAGIHAMATVLIAYLRTNVLTALMQKHLSDYANQSPGVKTMGWVPFLTYCLFLLALHHIVFFTMEMWSFTNITALLLKIVCSLLTSMMMVMIYALLFTRQTVLRS